MGDCWREDWSLRGRIPKDKWPADSPARGGMIGNVYKGDDGFYAIVYDLGPNVIACGRGATEDNAIQDLHSCPMNEPFYLDDPVADEPIIVSRK